MQRFGNRRSLTAHDGTGERLHSRHTIRGRLRWSYLLSSTLPLLLVGGLLIFFYSRTQQRIIYNTLDTAAQQLARDVSSYMQTVELELLRFGQMLDPDEGYAQIQERAVGYLSTHPDVRSLTIIDERGLEIVRVPIDEGPALDPVSRLDDPFVRSALRRGTGGRTDIRRQRDGQLLLTIVLPLRDDSNRVVGVISAEVSGAPIAQLMRATVNSPATVAYLTNAERLVLLTTAGAGWSPPASLHALFTNGRDVDEYRDGHGQRVVGAHALIKPGDWQVFFEQSSGEAFANVYRSIFLLATLVVVVGLLALGWGLFQAQQLLRPLNRLREGAAALGAGQLDERIEMSGSIEMDEVARAFNQMAEHLQASLTKIELQNDHLLQGLSLARDIQMGLLPTQPPWMNDSLAAYARSIPAYEVGGDFYTYLAINGGRAAVAVGDISGKGVGAALLMALTSSAVESQARQFEHPADILAGLNQLLTPRLRANRMNAALLFAVFDPQTATMTVANAGMIAPMILHCAQQPDGKHQPGTPMAAETRPGPVVRFVDVYGLPVGALPDVAYHQTTVSLSEGDIILFLSDGVVEAHNEEGEIFGFERLEQLIEHTTITDIRLIVDLIVTTVQDFIGQSEQHDDITLVAVRPSLYALQARHQSEPLTIDDPLPILT